MNFWSIVHVATRMEDTWQAFGLPLHPLLVHIIVVLLPLTALAMIVIQFWPAARRRAEIIVPIAAVFIAILVPVTVGAGTALRDVVGALPGLAAHERYGRLLIPGSIVLALVAIGQWVWFRRGRHAVAHPRTFTLLVGVIVVGVSVAGVVAVVLTGESGARAVWG